MHLLFLSDAVFEDLPGGSRMVARELARGLVRRGHEVTFLVPRHDSRASADERRDGLRLVRYGGAGRVETFVRAGQAAAARLWAEQPFDLVHTHFAYAALGPFEALPRATPHVRSFYGPWDREGWVEEEAGRKTPWGNATARVKRILRRQVESANLRRSQAVVVLSAQSRGEVLEFGYPAACIHQTVGGVDLERFRPAPDKNTVRQALGLPEGRRLLLSVRRLTARMGLDNLIEAMPAVVARHPEVLLLIGGKGPAQAFLEERVRTLGLEAHVQIIGFIPEETLAAYYQAAEVFVLPTVSLEGFGLVTVEALACGTPVVGTPVGATPEILTQLEARLVAPSATPDGLAEGLLRFLESPWRRDLTAERLHRFVRERYTWERHVEAVEAVYQEALARPVPSKF